MDLYIWMQNALNVWSVPVMDYENSPTDFDEIFSVCFGGSSNF